MPTIETELLERSHELGVIEETLDAALDGNGALLVIEGEAGAGKTSLLDAAARLGGERGVRVLRARGGEFERDFPYGIVRQLFEPILREEGGRDRLTGSAGLATAVFEGGGGASESDRFGVMQGIYWLIADLAEEEPIALLVDDLQWADLASLHSLLYVVRRLEGVPAAIFASVRTGEGGPSEDLVGQLRVDPSARTVAPAPLSREAVAELIGDRMGEVPSSLFSAACHAAGGGNPFLSVELARAASSRQAASTRSVPAVPAGRYWTALPDSEGRRARSPAPSRSSSRMRGSSTSRRWSISIPTPSRPQPRS
jgi:predicted ATPase